MLLIYLLAIFLLYVLWVNILQGSSKPHGLLLIFALQPQDLEMIVQVFAH